jgi:hypothetical protein
MRTLLWPAALLILTAPMPLAAAAPQDLPLLTLDDFVYRGAFRLPDDDFGVSNLNYSEGPIAYDAQAHSLFIVGHAHHQAVAEFAVPALSQATTLAELPMASAPSQSFVTLLDRTPDGNPQDLDRIGGMAVFEDQGQRRLLVNAYEYFDAPGDNTLTTLVVEEAKALEGSSVAGFFRFRGGAGHTSGWLSPIPLVWQGLLGGTHITGQSSGIPIISRTSVGPSAFAFSMDQFQTVASIPDPVPTTTLLDFSLDEPLASDLSNDSLQNTLWTHLSRVVYGFIVPGSRTYVTLGYSGGHSSGVCYKCVQDDGNLCGGYCAPDPNDYAQYYWLWDVNDLAGVAAGTLQASSIRPYAHGVFQTPFATHELGGGVFDPDSGLLYLTINKADTEQGTYSNPPVVVAYSFALTPPPPTPPATRGPSVAPPNYLLLK